MAPGTRERSREIIPGLILIFGAAMLGLAGCGRSSEKGEKIVKAVRTIPVTVAPVQRRKIERKVEVVGSLRAWEQVTIGSKKEGRVVKVWHDLGDRVKPGEPLVTLDSVDAELEVIQSRRKFEAELAQLGLSELPSGPFDPSKVPAVVRSSVALDRVKQNLSRDRSLAARGAGAKQDLQNAENDVASAEAALADTILAVQTTLANAQAARAALDVSIQARKDLEIKAPVPSKAEANVPIDGVYAISKRSVSEGQFLKVGDPVMELVIEKPLRLWTSVPERYTAEVKLGQPVRVHVPAFPETAFEGKLVRINPTIDSTSRTFQVESLVSNDGGKLRPGGFAKATIVIDTRAEATMVPLEAVVSYAGVTKVFVIENNASHPVIVETGLETQGWVEVLGKLPTDALVVTTGQKLLAEGTRVVVRKPETDEPAKTTAAK